MKKQGTIMLLKEVRGDFPFDDVVAPAGVYRWTSWNQTWGVSMDKPWRT
jgi:hypothetical protein